jgi:hypothetical protein
MGLELAENPLSLFQLSHEVLHLQLEQRKRLGKNGAQGRGLLHLACACSWAEPCPAPVRQPRRCAPANALRRQRPARARTRATAASGSPARPRYSRASASRLESPATARLPRARLAANLRSTRAAAIARAACAALAPSRAPCLSAALAPALARCPALPRRRTVRATRSNAPERPRALCPGPASSPEPLAHRPCACTCRGPHALAPPEPARHFCAACRPVPALARLLPLPPGSCTPSAASRSHPSAPAPRRSHAARGGEREGWPGG